MGLFSNLRKSLGYKPINTIELGTYRYFGLLLNGTIQKKDYTLSPTKIILKVYETNSMKIEIINRGFTSEYHVMKHKIDGDAEIFKIKKIPSNEILLLSIDPKTAGLVDYEDINGNQLMIFTHTDDDIF